VARSSQTRDKWSSSMLSSSSTWTDSSDERPESRAASAVYVQTRTCIIARTTTKPPLIGLESVWPFRPHGYYWQTKPKPPVGIVIIARWPLENNLVAMVGGNAFRAV